VHAVPVDGLAEGFFFYEIVTLTHDAFGAARCLVVVDLDELCKREEENLISCLKFIEIFPKKLLRKL
jgi:hypothetical protein